MIYAMFIVSILTISIGLIAVRARITSVKNGYIAASYFQLMKGQDVPDKVTVTTRCFNNLFEVPVLFYVVCTLYIALEIDSNIATVLAWLFAVFRCAQAYIHLNSNFIKHRMFAFGGSVLSAFLLWVNLLVKIA